MGMHDVSSIDHNREEGGGQRPAGVRQRPSGWRCWCTVAEKERKRQHEREKETKRRIERERARDRGGRKNREGRRRGSRLG